MFPITQHATVVNGILTSYKSVGEGEPIILVHGLAGSTHWWRRNIPELAAHYRLYLVDLPGFGSMWRQRRHFHLETCVEWLAAWTRAVKLDTFSLVGHSMGGYVALALAARHPERVKRLVLVSCVSVALEHSVVGYLPHLFLAGFRITPTFFPLLFFDSVRAGIPTLVRATKQIVDLDIAPVVTALQTPTLLIWGEHDNLVPLACAYSLQAQLAHVHPHLLVIKQASHVSMFEQPRQFNSAVLAFLEQQKE
jgi:pimeloyl-ACP methyl ester carboxylesterase